MARKQTGLIMKNNIEPTVSAPLDGRQQAKTYTELFEDGSYPKHYNGMIVSLKDTGDAYKLKGDPTTEESWKKILTEEDLQGYQTTITVDDALSETSTNPVQNKVVKEAIDAIVAADSFDYPITWDATTRELVLNEGEDVEQRLKLTGIPSSTDMPDVSGFAKTSDLAAVATSGKYEDLVEKPTIPAAYDDTAIAGRVTAVEDAVQTLQQGSYDDTEITGRVSAIEGQIGSHTVAKDVPSDAVFTDTVYDDTDLAQRVTTLEQNPGGGTADNVEWDNVLNKPENIVTDAAYVHTDNNFTNEDKTKLSSITSYDDTAISQRVSALEGAGYVTEQDVDTKLADYKVKELVPVQSLPTLGIREDVIYLLNDSDEDQNIYSEWYYKDNKWERFGSSSLNLDGYYTKEEVDAMLSGIVPATAEEITTVIEEVFGNTGGGGNDPGTDPNEP